MAPPTRALAAEVAVAGGDELGETPIWNEAAGVLHWVDLFAGIVFSLDPTSSTPRSFTHGTSVGAVAPRAGGGLLLAAGRSLVATDLEGGGAETLVTVEPDRPQNRFNDCHVDPAGRFFGGTMTTLEDRAHGRGALHRIDADLRATIAIDDTTIANGIGWSPAGDTLYFIDSPTRRLYAYEFDPATGELGSRRTVATIEPGKGYPDGLAVDAEGGVWVALAKGSAVRRYAPEGHLEAEVRLPVLNPTCPGFGGPDLRTLFVTTAHLRADPHYADPSPLAGALFALDPGVAGLPSAAFAG